VTPLAAQIRGTGRTLRGVPPQSLAEDELISFRADDHIPAPRTGSG